jgi:hypothetical protein
MADVGKKTDKQTQTGRDVYETPEGEMVSEKSTTFEYKGKWINIPTIHNGKQYSDAELIEMLEEGLIKPTSIHNKLEEAIQAAQSRSDSLEFNKGGIPMLEKQMELFNEGGLKDEGGEVDPVSGNDVPIGSTKEEVRDDIPAMVSEGEFVFPADVVRYIGLNNLMNMRQEAKMGLKKMEAMGQMGNSEEATLPDDMPFGMADIVIVEGSDEPKEMAQGGVVQAQTGTFVTPMFDPSNQDVREYKNEKGESLFIPFLNGEPVYPIPAGYSPVGQAPTETTPETPAPAEDDGGGGDDKPRVNAFTEAGSWAGAPLDMYIKEAEKVSAYGNMAAGATAALNPVVGAFVFGALKNEKRKLNNTIDARIKEAEKAGLTDSVAALKAVKKRMSPEGQSVLEQAQSTVVDAFKSLLGIEKGTEESAKVDKKIVDAGKVNAETTDAEIEKLSMAGSIDEAVNEGITKPKEEDTIQLETDESGLPSELNRMAGQITEQTFDTDIDRVSSGDKGDTGSLSFIEPVDTTTANVDLRSSIEGIINPQTALDTLNNVTNVIDQTQTSNLRGRNKGRTNIRSAEDQTNEILESSPVIKDTTSAGVVADKPSSVTAMRTKRKKDRKKKEKNIIQQKELIKETAKKFKEQGLVQKGMTPIQSVAKAQEQMNKPKEDPDANDPRRGMMKSGGLASRKK